MATKKSKSKKIDSVSPLEIATIAYGVRFTPLFGMMDKAGSIIDMILRTSGTPYGPKKFFSVRSNQVERALVNDKTNEYLRFTDRDIILELKINSRKLNDIYNHAVNFENFVLKPIHNLVKLDKIQRYGILFKLSECNSQLVKTPIQHFLAPDIDNANSLSLSFTKKLPVLEAQVKKGVSDYRNVIYIAQQSEKGEVTLSIDYQKYYIPPLEYEEFKEKPFPDFVDSGISYYKKNYISWLDKLINSTEVA